MGLSPCLHGQWHEKSLNEINLSKNSFSHIHTAKRLLDSNQPEQMPLFRTTQRDEKEFGTSKTYTRHVLCYSVGNFLEVPKTLRYAWALQLVFLCVRQNPLVEMFMFWSYVHASISTEYIHTKHIVTGSHNRYLLSPILHYWPISLSLCANNIHWS